MENLLDLYSDYLISSFGQTTATGLATLLNDQVSHDQITRMLARKPQTSTVRETSTCAGSIARGGVDQSAQTSAGHSRRFSKFRNESYQTY